MHSPAPFTVDARANATLEPWKRATLADLIRAAADAADALANNGVAVPAAYRPIAVAQALLESGWGRSQLAQLGRNYFGIKAVGDQPTIELLTTEYVTIGGQSIPRRVAQPFRRFGSMAECFLAHARLLCTRPQYAPARAHGDDPAAFARALTGVYATDPHYHAKLVAVLRDRGLCTTFGLPTPEAVA